MTKSARLTVVVFATGLALWAGLTGGLAYLLYARTHWLRESDEANLREWLDEGRVFRKALPDIVEEYLALRDGAKLPPDDSAVVRKREEISEQLKRLVEPTRIYQAQVPLFPDIFRLEVSFPSSGWEPIVWDSPLPRPRQKGAGLSVLRYSLLGDKDQRAEMRCEYRLHAYNVRQREAEDAQRQLAIVIGLILIAGLSAVGGTYWLLQRERRREFDRVQSAHKAEQAEKLVLEETLARREAESTRDELDRKLLQQRLEAARQESRAAEAERSALEMRSQLYASIGIMAGSYAHNIKNLLVRPNDLLARCIDSEPLSADQQDMLQEVRQTLSTVTERLQQILRTVRRHPSRTEAAPLDLNHLLRELHRGWDELARDKWKLNLRLDLAPGSLFLSGDESHLQQAIENLIFNARDATFDMRNHLRDQARREPVLDDSSRRAAILDAAAWRGEVALRTRRDGQMAVFEIQDNGIGMTEDIRRHCTETYFSTKRNNALYEGYTAGMGLGLSFVTAILGHHHAQMEIDSTHLAGTTFRIRLPLLTEPSRNSVPHLTQTAEAPL